ncbi:DUF3710 domain-containing protein [Corynebacterium kroppenstedtii]|uniref:DUF3710 domain-containing protein n=1 Tax=Corynebacterium sp. PCR 32 TaxID=3351342 RepID=UPI00309C1344
MWPFEKKNQHYFDKDDIDDQPGPGGDRDEYYVDEFTSPQEFAASEPRLGSACDAMEGDSGPFDSRRKDLNRFDFSDFAKGDIDLGSLLVPIPHEAEIQVEVSPEGPRAVHLASPYGRVTPVAFAAPRSGGLWDEQLSDIEHQIASDGLHASRESGPWGIEIIGTGPHGIMHMIGVDGPGWMLRLTAVGPAESHDELVAMTRGIVSRTVVKRGDGPIPAGETLPVALPEDMVQELHKAIAQRAAEVDPVPDEQHHEHPPAVADHSHDNAGHRRVAGEASARMESAMDELDSEEDDGKH